MIYDRTNWYWIVDESDTQVYSSKTGDYVPITDAAYISWRAAGGVTGRIIGSDMIVMRIEILEASVTPRRLREAITGADSCWLANLNSQIVALRAQL